MFSRTTRLFIFLVLILLNSCVYRKVLQDDKDGRKEILHIGFPEFSDGKAITLFDF